jgi:hypothetical protein
VPAEQGLWLHEEPASALRIKEPTQACEQTSVAGPQRWAKHLTTEDGDLVAKHDDLDRQLLVASPQEPDQLEPLDEAQMEEGPRHGPASSFGADLRKSCSDHPDDIFGTHRYLAPTRLRPVASGQPAVR